MLRYVLQKAFWYLSSSPSVWPKLMKMVMLSMNLKLMKTATLSCRRFPSSTKTASRS